MLAELDVVIFLKSNDGLERVAERVFGTLQSSYEQAAPDETGETYYKATGLGFHALLFANTGEMLDPEFETYHFGLEITSQFWCVELDTLEIETPLSEYFARQIAFELDVETATEILLETNEESEVFEIRSYRRNPQYRLDQAPTTPKVFVVETRQVEEAFEDRDWDAGDGEYIDDTEISPEGGKESR
ncbi:MAG: hypothetical protein NVSMB52_18030 [Chloroflexota bacterium]